MSTATLTDATSSQSDAALFIGPHTDESVTEQVASIALTRFPAKLWWWFAGMFTLVLGLLVAATYLFVAGVGIWGVNIPVAWGFAIVNFVWWIGIGHAGTLISAVLFLLRQHWRTSINRFSEAMTLFAVACAGLFPILHLGRPYVFYWLLPYPDTMGLWPQWRSPLVWDAFAIMTYFTVSLLFWYSGLLPDLATMRDRARHPFVRRLFGVAALGWTGSARAYRHYDAAYLLLAGLATPLVVSVHSIVSLDFSAGLVPGWHSTIFPPYFVAGAIYSGFAMVLTLLLPARSALGLHSLITQRHIDFMVYVMLVSGLLVGYGYMMEGFDAWYSRAPAELFVLRNRLLGPYAVATWCMLACNVLIPQLLWSRRVRKSVAAVFVLALVINVGMWLERFVIVITALHRDYLPSAWGMYIPTFWDWLTFVGTIGLFTSLMFLFVRTLPMIAMSEVRHVLHEVSGAAAEHAP